MIMNGVNAYFEELYNHFYAAWLNKFAHETYSRGHFNTVFNSLWTEYKRDHKRRQEGGARKEPLGRLAIYILQLC
jgi:hypothetical protein